MSADRDWLEEIGARYRGRTTPAICPRCEEPILPGDRVALGFHPRHHYACGLRAVIGSVAHLERRCSCYVEGADDGDDPGLTKRQAADAAVRLWEQQEYEARDRRQS